MEPCERLLLSFPVYGMAVLSDGTLAIAGGGGRMRSGVSNGCVSGCFSIGFIIVENRCIVVSNQIVIGDSGSTWI